MLSYLTSNLHTVRPGTEFTSSSSLATRLGDSTRYIKHQRRKRETRGRREGDERETRGRREGDERGGDTISYFSGYFVTCVIEVVWPVEDLLHSATHLGFLGKFELEQLEPCGFDSTRRKVWIAVVDDSARCRC